MADRCLKYLSIKSMIIIAVLIDEISALSICPTAVWALNATTVAGSSSGSSGSTLTKLKTPIAVIVDNNSNTYVADTGNYRVLQFPVNSTTGVLRINGSFGTGLNQFSSMTDMGMDANGNIYILDGTLARVTKWTPGSASGILVAGGGPFNDYFDGHVDSMGQPGGMFIEPQSLFIWIADTNNSRIVKWVNSSTVLTVCGSYGANSNQFINPLGLFVDTTAGNTLYVVDSGNHRIQRWLPGATTGETVAGITSYYGSGLNQLWSPIAIVVDSNQNMYITDRLNWRILQWKVGASFGIDIAGTALSKGTAPNLLGNPSSVSFDSNGSLFVADTTNNRVQKFAISCPTNISTTTVSSVVTTMMPISTSTCPMTVWALNATIIAGSPIGIVGLTSTLLDGPTDVWVGNNDSIYVIDWGTYYRVQLFYPGSQSGITIFNASYGTNFNQFSSMDAFSIDMSGNIYILDNGNSRVTKWAPGASAGIVVAGGNGSGSSLSKLNSPYGIFVEPNTSYIWIADSNNNRIVKWINTSTAILVAGGGTSGSKANQLYYPEGLFVDTSDSNTLYVADTYNHRIQKWLYGASNGTTMAGQSTVYGSALNQLSSPATLIMDTNGSMYIVDYGNHRIVLWLLGATSGTVIAGSNTYGVLPSQLYHPYSVRLDSTGAFIVPDHAPNTVSSSTTSVSTNSISITATLQNTTITVPLTTNSLTTSTNNPTTILSASTSIAGSVTPSTTVSTSAIVTPSTTVSSSAVVTPSTTVPTSPTVTPPTTVSTSAVVTPSTTVSTSAIATSLTKVSSSAIVTPSTTVSMSTLVTTSQKSNSINTITKLSSTMAASSQSTNHSFAIRNLNSKLLVLSFCFIMIFINN
ncbi:unnamed protein product [Adineta steineri]|uniref:NHL repeat containing protein-like protein n=1 Tax=Adineta steineri TaxID=433720 RepID=A0A814IP14_9BILA|nr:unnamed protein product [Adineta steineri]CAF1515527.1 unnamed protein product [Adineta steineri]